MLTTTRIPDFECRELRTLIPQINQKGKELLDLLPASQKTAAYALKYSHYFTIYPAVPFLFAGVYTFSITPIAIAIGLAASAFAISFIVNKIFGSTGKVFLYKNMQELNPTLLGFTSSTCLHSPLITSNLEKAAEDFRIRSHNDLNVKPMLEAFRAFAHMQIALSEFHSTLNKGTHINPKMSQAAEKACEICENIQDGNFGINKNHKIVLAFLDSRECLENNEFILHKTDVFNLFKQKLTSLDKSIYVIPMLNLSTNSPTKDLYTYLTRAGAEIIGAQTLGVDKL